MAKAKKSTPKQQQKAAAKPKNAAKSNTPRAAAEKVAAKPLTTEEKQRLIKPIDGFPELTERFAAAWSDRKAQNGGVIAGKIVAGARGGEKGRGT